MPSAIDPAQIPGADIAPDVIEAQAAVITRNAAAVRDSGAGVHAKWQGMAAVYSAPESGTLLGLMDPVNAQATQAGDNLEVVGRALADFAAEVRPIKAELDRLRAQAQAFVDTTVAHGVSVRQLNPAWVSAQSMYGYSGHTSYSGYSGYSGSSSTTTQSIPQYQWVHKDWHEDQGAVDRNNELIAAVNAQQVLLWQAERACANRIRALYGAPPLRAFQSENDTRGYGLDEIPEGTEMPWGAAVERSESCGEATVNFVVKDFLWEGIAVGGIWGTVQGLGTLVLGYNPQTGAWFDGDAYGAAWGNLGNLGLGLVIAATPPLNVVFAIDDAAQMFGGGILPQELRDIKDRTDEAWLNTGKALVAWDKWQDDPGTALGETVFNVGTILIPAGAAVAGVKTAGTAASVLSKMARVVDLIDPGALAVNGVLKGGGFAFRGLDDLLRNTDSLVQGEALSFDFSDLDVFRGADAGTAIDHLVDDLGIRVDDIRVRIDEGIPVVEAPGIRIELSEGAFDVPAPVREPELVMAGGARAETGPGAVNSIVDDASVRTETGGSGGEPTIVREPETTTTGGGAGHGSGDADGGVGHGSGDAAASDPVSPDPHPGSSHAEQGEPSSPQDPAVPDASQAAAPPPRHEGPMYSSDAKGPHWERIGDTGTADGQYGLPRADHGHVQPWYESPAVDNPEVGALVDDPAAPFGRDEHGDPIPDQDAWNERYAKPDQPNGDPGGVRWPANDGAVPGSRVSYDDLGALMRDYPEFGRIDRIGMWGGDYLTVEGTVFEQRGLTPGHRAMDYSAFDLTPPLPSGVKVEISVIDEALGYPGGGWQIRFFRSGPDGKPSFLSIDDLIDLGVLT